VLLNYHIGLFVLSSLCVGDLVRLVLSSARFAGWSTTVLQPAKRTPPKSQPHQMSNTQRTENKTTDVVIQQHSRRLLMMAILMSETCWAHKKWNKIASDIQVGLSFFSYLNSKSDVYVQTVFSKLFYPIENTLSLLHIGTHPYLFWGSRGPNQLLVTLCGTATKSARCLCQVRPCQRGSHWTDFREIWYWGTLVKIRGGNSDLITIIQKCRTLCN